MQASKYLMYCMCAVTVRFIVIKIMLANVFLIMTSIHEMQKQKAAHYQQWQIHKCAMSHCDAKGQRPTEVTKVLVDFVHLVAADKVNAESVCKYISSMWHQHATLHLYFGLHSKLNFHFLKQNHVFTQTQKKWVADKKGAYRWNIVL